VIFNFDRMRRQEAPQFSPIAADYNQMAIQSVKDVRALDEHTVEIILSEPFPEFLRCMTQEDAPGSVVIISPTALNRYGNEKIADRAPGTGPFKFERRFNTRYGSSVEIVRNDDYWAGPPHLDGIRFTPFPSADDRAQALLDGEVDLAYGPEPRRLRELHEKGFIVSEGLIPYVWYFTFNTRNRPFAMLGYAERLSVGLAQLVR
jgi:peptide/nickel transport system substrate-binding protein